MNAARADAPRAEGDAPPVPAPSGRGSLVPALLALLVVVAALLLAGRGGPVASGTAPTGTVATPDQRQVVCPGTGTDSTTYVGLLPGARGGSVSVGGRTATITAGGREEITDPARDPVTVLTTGGASRGIFADRVEDRGGVARCGTPRASWWFTGAGAGPSHRSTLEVYNPRPGTAVVDVQVYSAKGPVKAAGLRGIALPSGQRTAIDLADSAPADGNLAVHVQVSRGLVVAAVADRTLDLLDTGAKPATEWLPDQLRPARRVVLGGVPPGTAAGAEPGASLPVPQAIGDSAGLVVANPGSTEAVVRIGLSDKNGAVALGVAARTVPPGQVVTIPLVQKIQKVQQVQKGQKGQKVDGAGTAIVVDADRPVTAGYVVPGATDLVHAVPGVRWEGPAAVALPSRATNTLVLTADAVSGGARSATVTLVERADDGTPVARRSVAVPVRSTVTVPLDAAAATVVVTGRRDVVGEVLVERRGRFSAVPLAPVLSALRVPAVRPDADPSAR